MKLTLLTQSPEHFLYKFQGFSVWLERFRAPGPKGVIRSLKK